MFIDEGVTGTSTKHREGFKTMIADALAGKIDLILTKSVSRFARNAVDTLTYVCQLKDAGVEVYFEKENIWSASTIRSILSNEKYAGDALLQKSFTTGFRTKTKKTNEGEVPQYYVTGNHEPIIEHETWQIVQSELARRSGKGTTSAHPFATRIKCVDCGGWFGRKVWHSNSKYRRHIWRCNNKYKPGYHCTTPHVTGQQIKEAFAQALTERVKDNATLDHMIRLIDDTVYNTTELETRQTKIAKKMEETVALINQLITENATTVRDPDEYDQRYHQLELKCPGFAS